MVCKYKLRVGSRKQVMNNTAKMTAGGLIKSKLKYNKRGRIVSKKASKLAKKNNRLVNAGYITKKGIFGVVKKGGSAVFEPPETSVNAGFVKFTQDILSQLDTIRNKKNKIKLLDFLIKKIIERNDIIPILINNTRKDHTYFDGVIKECVRLRNLYDNKSIEVQKYNQLIKLIELKKSMPNISKMSNVLSMPTAYLPQKFPDYKFIMTGVNGINDINDGKNFLEKQISFSLPDIEKLVSFPIKEVERIRNMIQTSDVNQSIYFKTIYYKNIMRIIKKKKSNINKNVNNLREKLAKMEVAS